MKIIVITGGIASGKSTVLNFLHQNSYTTIDCDKISQRVFQQNEDKIIKIFGSRILKNGHLHRPSVRSLIFTDQQAKQKLENIIHPRVFFTVLLKLIYLFFTNKDVVFVEVPLFFECKLDKYADSILIYCNKKEQMRRIIYRDGENNSENVINNQMCIEEKRKRATYIIENNGNMEELKKNISNFRIKGNRLSDYILVGGLILIFIQFNK